MVLALQGTNGLNALKDKCAEKWLIAYEQKNGKYPEPQLENFLGLYERIKSDRILLDITSKPFKPKLTQEASVRKLNKIRNEFIHFTPKSWSLEVSGLYQITIDCIDIISFLVFDCGNVFWYEESLEKRTKELIEHIGKLATTLGTTKAG